MDNLECDGGEASLSDCRFDGWGKHDCKENEGAGVVCDVPEAVTQHPVPVKPSKIKLKVDTSVLNLLHFNLLFYRFQHKEKGNWKIRIRGGRMSQEGRVELKTHNTGAKSSWILIFKKFPGEFPTISFLPSTPKILSFQNFQTLDKLYFNRIQRDLWWRMEPVGSERCLQRVGSRLRDRRTPDGLFWRKPVRNAFQRCSVLRQWSESSGLSTRRGFFLPWSQGYFCCGYLHT